MEIEQSLDVPFPIEQVWRCFRDTEGIVSCLPGASLTAPPDNGKLKLAMAVKLGPIAAAFAGDGEMLLDDATREGSVSGGGSDRKSGSRVKGRATFSLREEPGPQPGTRVDLRVEYSIAGSLAQFSRGGIVRELAARLTEAFAQNLRQKLEAENSQPQLQLGLLPASAASLQEPETKSDTECEPVPLPTPTQPLDLGGLFWPMLVERIRRLLRLEARH